MDLPIGARIRRWRQHRGMTLKQLAEAAGLHTSSLHRMEHSQQEPKHSDLSALANAIGISLADFYALTPPDHGVAEAANG